LINLIIDTKALNEIEIEKEENKQVDVDAQRPQEEGIMSPLYKEVL
jgi:hypothetical protein